MKTLKSIIIIFFTILLCHTSWAQISGMSYKAVIKDANDNLVINTTIQVRFNILQETGVTTLYIEDHNPTTDSNGIVVLTIGAGTTVFGNISTIDWGGDNHFLNVQIDIGNGLVDMGLTQFKTVPYAYHAQSVAAYPHDHLGETWTGTSPLTINRTDDNISSALVVSNPLGTAINIPPSQQGINIQDSGGFGIIVQSAGFVGMEVNNSGNMGGRFRGVNAGVYARATDHANPDLIVGGLAGNENDDGIISSDPNYAGSDIFLRSYDAVVVELDFDNNETGQFEIKAGDGSEIFEINENGNATLSGSLTQNSDRRLKKDITNLSYGLEEILQLQPKAYNWKNKEEAHKSLGLIAQDVQPIIKEIVNVSDDEQNTLGISYTELIPVLINAIKEQNKRIENLEAKLGVKYNTKTVAKN